MRLRTALFALALLFPLSAFAMRETVWDFRGGNVPSGWKMSGFQAEATDAGLHLTAEGTATMVAEIALPHGAQVVSLSIVNTRTAAAELLWHNPGDPDGIFTQLPFVLPGTNGDTRIVDINVEAFPQWKGRPDTIGFAMPQGADLLLQQMHFQQWNLFERMREAFKSFWTFDRWTPYSINFLWGPMLAFNPVAAKEIFWSLPPRGTSASYAFYGAAIAAAIGCILHRVFRKGKRNELVAFFLCVAALWGLYDIRMGAELLSYAKNDYDTYISQPRGQRPFRSYEYMIDFAEEAATAARGETSIAVLQRSIPIVAMLRYFAYPAVPHEADAPSDDAVWVVFDRPDVAVGDDGRLTVDGVPFSAPGKIVRRYDPNSFIFTISEQ